MEKQIKKRNNVTFSTGGVPSIEFTHKNANKGFGLWYLAEHLNIPLKNTVAIGDQLSDIPMFKVAGISIAMGNASNIVKSHATYITNHHDRNGVASALKKYVLKMK